MLALLEPSNLIALVAALACFATVVTLAKPLMAGDRLVGRLKSVAVKREELRRKSRKDLEKPANIRQEAKGMLPRVVAQLNLRNLLEDSSLQDKLLRAGLRGPMPTNIFYFCRLALPIAFGIAAFAYLQLPNIGESVHQRWHLMIVAGATAVGFYGPNIYLTNLIAKRQASIMRAFPDALDMMLICVEAGMSMELALLRVSQEIGAASVELAEELSLTTAELAYLADRRMAYENLGKRTNHPGVKSVAMALTQAEKYGTPVGQALRIMAKENRELRLSAAEKKAAALPAQLTVPMIVFFLPVLFVVILGPAAIQISEQFSK